MKKFYFSVYAVLGLICTTFAQNPGLLISEFLQNPAGSDSPFEYVELLATDDIDFAATPYTIMVSNNGTATANGWIEGGSRTYAFEISTGTVSVGDVVYVGGVSMAPTGTILRAIDTGADGGDGGIGSASAGGVLGNGGSNGDGIAVFNLPVASITSSTVPTDAIFYGSALGGAVVGPTEGYELPVNDHYDGGKLSAASFVAVDENLTVATGVYDLTAFEFTDARAFGGGDATDGVSEITFADMVPPSLSFVEEDITVTEDAGLITIEVAFAEPNGTPTSFDVVVRGSSTAENTADYVLVDTTVTTPGTAEEVLSFTLQIEEDVLEEQSEYIILTLDSLVNAELGENKAMFVYITDNDRVLPTATNELKFELLTSFSTGTEELSSAEIVAFDEDSELLLVANSIANQIDIIDFSTPAVPVLLDSIDLDSVGFINSIAVFDGVIATAIQAPVAQDSGFVSFFAVDGTFLNRLTVGAMPDMLTFNHEGNQIVVACEGEPDDDYTVDPNGGVSIIDLDAPYTDLTAANVTNLDFTPFEADMADLVANGLRIFGMDATLAQDLEPEYITVLNDDETAFVVLQENNGIVEVDLSEKEILDIYPLGTIDHSLFGFGLDASNRTSGINIANFPIQGMFMPDAIAQLEVGGTSYLFTANEGDSRDYDGYSEEERVDDLNLDSLTFLDRDFLQNDHLLGRLKTTTATGDTDGDGDIDVIHSYGTRSFSVWDTEGELLFDSGDLIEQIIAADPIYVDLFNRGNEADDDEAKNRSDDKGPEPEGVAAAMIDDNAYLFVSLERVGGAMAFNINDPENPIYIGYHNNRDVATNGPDRGAEGMIFIDAEISPNDNGLLILANEVSSTLTIYQINSCIELSEFELTTADDFLTTFCEDDSLEIIATGSEGLTYQWSFAGTEIEGAEANNYFATETGFYQVGFTNETEGCEGISDSVFVTELPNPSPVITVTDAVLSAGVFASYQWYFEGEEIAGATAMEYTPTEDGEYTVVVTGENGCNGEASITVNFTNIAKNKSFGFTLYPNPTNGNVSITLAGNKTNSVTIEIIDITGEVVYYDQISDSALINLQHLSTGIYFVRSSFGKITQSQKLVIK